jgi:hypothetical protein
MYAPEQGVDGCGFASQVPVVDGQQWAGGASGPHVGKREVALTQLRVYDSAYVSHGMQR